MIILIVNDLNYWFATYDFFCTGSANLFAAFASIVTGGYCDNVAFYVFCEAT